MTDELAGKIAIVTGAASGIGRGVAERFLAEGAQVVLADVNAEQGEAVAAEAGSNARFKQTDVSDQDQVRELVSFAVETFGGLHVMFNNAGISGARHPRLLDDDLVDFHKVTGVNLLGVMAGTREAARHMSTNGGGSIINISSIGGIQAAPGLFSYHTSKVGVIFFTKCAAVDVGEYGIRVELHRARQHRDADPRLGHGRQHARGGEGGTHEEDPRVHPRPASDQAAGHHERHRRGRCSSSPATVRATSPGRCSLSTVA